MLSKLPLLHFDGIYPEGLWHSNWEVDPAVLGLCFVLIAGYLALIGPINERYPGFEERTVSRKQIWCYIGGVLIMAVALGPPFHDWADYFLLSAHMTQHLVLMLVTAPLMLLGIPAWFFNPITARPWLDKLGALLFKPAVSFLIANVIMVAWHLPVLYNAALENSTIHGLQHQAFLISGIFSWWAIIAPNPRWDTISPLIKGFLLFAAGLPGMVVGAMITLAEPGVYSFYDTAPRLWGFSLQDDQELAGGMMWALVPLVYLGALSVVFLRYASREQAKDLATSPQRSPEGAQAPSTPAGHSGS